MHLEFMHWARWWEQTGANETWSLNFCELKEVHDYLPIHQVLWDPHGETPDHAWEEKSRHITENSGI